MSLFCAFQAGRLPLAFLVMPLCQVDVFSSFVTHMLSTWLLHSREAFLFVTLNSKEGKIESPPLLSPLSGGGGHGGVNENMKNN